jgi:pyrroline-5-carboxylate reductase
LTYGIVGVGAIASAIVTGLCEKRDDAESILLSPRNAATAADLAARFETVGVAATNQAVIDGSSVLILCLRPQVSRPVLRGLRFSEQQSIISVMAGTSLETLRELVAPADDIARAVPMPSVATRDGTTPIYPATQAAKRLFDWLGTAIPIPSADMFEAMWASTATVAAHFAYLNAISEWLTTKGIPEELARRQVAAIFAGLATKLRCREPVFEELAREHATPGGINEQFLRGLKEAQLFDTVDRGLDNVLQRLMKGISGS